MEILRVRDWPSRPGTIFQMPPCKEGQRRDTWLAGEGCEEELPWKAPVGTGRRFAMSRFRTRVRRIEQWHQRPIQSPFVPLTAFSFYHVPSPLQFTRETELVLVVPEERRLVGMVPEGLKAWEKDV